MFKCINKKMSFIIPVYDIVLVFLFKMLKMQFSIITCILCTCIFPNRKIKWSFGQTVYYQVHIIYMQRQRERDRKRKVESQLGYTNSLSYLGSIESVSMAGGRKNGRERERESQDLRETLLAWSITFIDTFTGHQECGSLPTDLDNSQWINSHRTSGHQTI